MTTNYPLYFMGISKRISIVGILLFSVSLLGNLRADEIGLEIGEKAPAFNLMNQRGEATSLSGLTAEHGKVALAFFRSADWCPFCQRQLIDLQANIETLEGAGVKLVGISYDSMEVLERFSKKQSIDYTLLSDPGSKTIDAYKVRNEGARPGRSEGIPHPTVFLVNRDGVITAKLREENMKIRPTIEAIVSAANAMD